MEYRKTQRIRAVPNIPRHNKQKIRSVTDTITRTGTDRTAVEYYKEGGHRNSNRNNWSEN